MDELEFIYKEGNGAFWHDPGGDFHVGMSFREDHVYCLTYSAGKFVGEDVPIEPKLRPPDAL